MNSFQFPPETVAVIPAAGGRRGMWNGVSAASCDAMFPVAGRPAVYWTLQELLRVGVRRVSIVVRDRGNDLEKFASLLFQGRMDLRFTVPDAMRGVGYSVSVGAGMFETEVPTLVVLGDTIASFNGHEPVEHDFVHVSEVRDWHRWCLADVHESRVTYLVDKPSSDVGLKLALTGIYYFSKGIGSISGLPEDGPIEMSHLLQPAIGRGELYASPASRWLDVGNADHVFEAHSRLLQARSFNRLDVDNVRGTITKRSAYETKFLDEINYYKLLPERLAIYFPRIVASDSLPSRQSLTMEFYAYPSLADLFVFGKLSPELWRRIFLRLKEVTAEFHGDDYGPGVEMVDEVYVVKNRDRLRRFVESPPAECAGFVRCASPRVNGRCVIPLSQAFAVSESALKALGTDSRLSIVHGDLCLSNILCEPCRCLIKFVDPRGSFGRQGVVGDPRYDIAKMEHSVIGLYDFMVTGIFRMSSNGGAVTLDIPVDDSVRRIQAEYLNVFAGVYERREIALLSAWLFLSMLPLHADSPSRQLALAARGLELLTDVLQ